MSVAAVICEYNPFHNGHAYQIEHIRELLGGETVILALMSGSVVQRGETAVASKYARAAAAITMGADLVLELPYPYSASVAEHFALGAVSILNSLSVVDYLVFGSEMGDMPALQEHVKRRFSPEFSRRFVELRKENKTLSFPLLVEHCYRELYDDLFPKDANDILGVFYLKALADLRSRIIPIAHPRLKGASATAARKAMYNGDNGLIPEKARGFFSLPPASLVNAQRAILYGLRSCNEKKMRDAAIAARGYEDLTERLSGKNYTDARIRRGILHNLFGYCEDSFAVPVFTTVLAMNEKGAALLHRAKRVSKISIVTKPADYKKYPGIAPQFEHNLKADELFSLAVNDIMPSNWSLLSTPYVKK